MAAKVSKIFLGYVNWLNLMNAPGTISAPSSTFCVILMLASEMVPESSVIFNQLTWLIAQEDYINCRSVLLRFCKYNQKPNITISEEKPK
jgi:hypothetical protein